MHEVGFGMDVSYGYADKNIMKTIEEGGKQWLKLDKQH
jgi:hypothetical protein